MKDFLNIFKGEDVFQASRPLAISSFLLVAIILTSLLSVRCYFLQNNFVNGIAQKTIVAKNSFEVVDKRRTEIIKKEVANKIPPIVVPLEAEYIKADLQKIIDEIEYIKKEKKTYKEKQENSFNSAT